MSFRVALPTYGYVAAFDAAGRFVGLSAEGAAARRPAGGRLRTVRTDPAAMVELLNAWTADRPACMTGVIWFRLPTPDDRLNWSGRTFAAVLSRRFPRPKLVARTRRTKPGLVEIDLHNVGDADAELNATVCVKWLGAARLAADALGPFEPAGLQVGEMHFVPTRNPAAPRPVLRSGARIAAGWIRLSKDTEVNAHVLDAKP